MWVLEGIADLERKLLSAQGAGQATGSWPAARAGHRTGQPWIGGRYRQGRDGFGFLAMSRIFWYFALGASGYEGHWLRRYRPPPGVPSWRL